MAFKKKFVTINHSPSDLEDLVNTKFAEGWEIYDIYLMLSDKTPGNVLIYLGYIIFSWGAKIN